MIRTISDAGRARRCGLATRTLSAACCCLLAGCAHGRPLRIEPLQGAQYGAGCTYALSENLPAIFEVVYRSIPDDRIGIAQIRVDGVQYVLDRIGADEAGRFVYSRGSVRVETFDYVELGSTCESSECEGSRYKASLRIVTPDASEVVSVLAHCGA